MGRVIHYIILRFVQMYNIKGLVCIYNTMYNKNKLVYLQCKGLYIIIRFFMLFKVTYTREKLPVSVFVFVFFSVLNLMTYFC